MTRIDISLIAAGLMLAGGVATACMFDLNFSFTQQRQAVFALAPMNSFRWEAAHLVAPSSLPHKLVDQANPSGIEGAVPRPIDLATAERIGLPPDQIRQIASMRGADDDDAAFLLGPDVPEAIRAYVAGAVAFHHQNWDDAIARFNEVLTLPPDRAAPRAVWAAYMLGRSYHESGDDKQALAAYAQARQLAMGGAPDPLGLGLASLGDEAKLHLDSGDIAGAVTLYAQQAADGSDSGAASLRIVAEKLADQPDQLGPAMKDALVQKLMVAFALSASGDFVAVRSSDYDDDLVDYDMVDLEVGHHFNTDDQRWAPIARAVIAGGRPVDDQGQFSALLYRLGDYAAAKSVAAQETGPLALWVAAKLAWRDGDKSAAAQLCARAVAAARAGQTKLDPSALYFLNGDHGLIALSRGDFVTALTILWQAGGQNWADVAYVAERVLTVDELKAFVDRYAPAADKKYDAQRLTHASASALRNLLARRLMRADRAAEALAYFTDPTDADDTALACHPLCLRNWAAALADAEHKAQQGAWPSDRARAQWQAAQALRWHGMELVGTEGDPDNKIIDGDLATDQEFQAIVPRPASPAMAGLLTKAEQDRVAATAVTPDYRFHYRYNAVDRALAAASLLPARSQAYAAILCQADGWMQQTNQPAAAARAKSLYRQYVSTGAIVPFATHFGHGCPDPDFSTLDATRRKLAVIMLRDAVHRDKWIMLGSVALIGLLAAAYRFGKRRGSAAR